MNGESSGCQVRIIIINIQSSQSNIEPTRTVIISSLISVQVCPLRIQAEGFLEIPFGWKKL
jgi:hypothetical protein